MEEGLVEIAVDGEIGIRSVNLADLRSDMVTQPYET